jgi:hypothetical protein
MAGNALTAVAASSALAAADFAQDITAPTLDAFSLDIDTALLTLTFSETVKVSSLDVSGVTLQHAATATQNNNVVSLSTSSTQSGDGVEVAIALSSDDLNAVKLAVGLATSADNTFLVISGTTIADMAGINVQAVVDGSGIKVATFQGDTQAPEVSSFDFSLEQGKMTVVFSEAVKASTFSVGELAMQAAASVDVNDATKLLAVVGTASQADGTTITVTLSASMLNNLKSLVDVGASKSTTFLTFTSAMVKDMAGIDVVARANGNALQVSDFVADTTAPELASFDFKLSSGVPPLKLEMTFTEIVDSALGQFDVIKISV